MASTKAWYSRVSKMLPSIPLGPPLPKREVIMLLKRVRKVIDQVITQLERDAKQGRRTARRAR